MVKLLVFLVGCLSQIALADYIPVDAPNPVPPTYDVPITYPAPVHKVKLSAACSGFLWRWVCTRSESFELALEREYWAYVQNTDRKGMSHWLQKMMLYAERSDTPYKGRLYMLGAFGSVMNFRSTEGVAALTSVMTAVLMGQKAEQEQPHNPSTLAINGYLKAFMSFGTFNYTGGMHAIEDLRALNTTYGVTEGDVIAAYGLIGLKHRDSVQQGLDLIADATTADAQWTSSIAPFKMVGNYLTVAEGKAYLGDRQGALQAMQLASDWAKEHGMPQAFLLNIKTWRDDLLDESGLADQWDAGNTGLGWVRMPLAPSQSSQACAACHIGNQVPDHYYRYK